MSMRNTLITNQSKKIGPCLAQISRCGHVRWFRKWQFSAYIMKPKKSGQPGLVTPKIWLGLQLSYCLHYKIVD